MQNDGAQIPFHFPKFIRVMEASFSRAQTMKSVGAADRERAG
jgi:hypothetical protein